MTSVVDPDPEFSPQWIRILGWCQLKKYFLSNSITENEFQFKKSVCKPWKQLYRKFKKIKVIICICILPDLKTSLKKIRIHNTGIKFDEVCMLKSFKKSSTSASKPVLLSRASLVGLIIYSWMTNLLFFCFSRIFNTKKKNSQLITVRKTKFNLNINELFISLEDFLNKNYFKVQLHQWPSQLSPLHHQLRLPQQLPSQPSR